MLYIFLLERICISKLGCCVPAGSLATSFRGVDTQDVDDGLSLLQGVMCISLGPLERKMNWEMLVRDELYKS
jgi:hypothetical protein